MWQASGCREHGTDAKTGSPAGFKASIIYSILIRCGVSEVVVVVVVLDTRGLRWPRSESHTHTQSGGLLRLSEIYPV